MNCQNLVGDTRGSRVDLRACRRVASYIVWDKRTGEAVEYLCTDHRRRILVHGEHLVILRVGVKLDAWTTANQEQADARFER